MIIVLASASERRVELLSRLTADFSVVVSDFDEESVDYDGSPDSYVMELSKGKASSAATKIEEFAYIIACDTVVVCDNEILGKPKDKAEAAEMLKRLSGRYHQVYSGVTVLDTKLGKYHSDYVKTEVKFSDLSDEEIVKYVDSKEPMDKAGAYGIQGLGGLFVEEIHGDYYSVVGLPINKLKYILRGMGVNL